MALKVKIELVTTISEINKVLSTFTKEVNAAYLETFVALGEELTERARNSGQYRNVTFNLVSSIGYQVGSYGKVLRSSFSRGRRVGAAKGRETATAVIAQYPNDEFVLVVVAGMHYATIVEARGKDVLTSTELYARTKVPAALQALNIT